MQDVLKNIYFTICLCFTVCVLFIFSVPFKCDDKERDVIKNDLRFIGTCMFEMFRPMKNSSDKKNDWFPYYLVSNSRWRWREFEMQPPTNEEELTSSAVQNRSQLFKSD